MFLWWVVAVVQEAAVRVVAVVVGLSSEQSMASRLDPNLPWWSALVELERQTPRPIVAAPEPRRVSCLVALGRAPRAEAEVTRTAQTLHEVDHLVRGATTVRR